MYVGMYLKVHRRVIMHMMVISAMAWPVRIHCLIDKLYVFPTRKRSVSDRSGE